MMDTHYENPIPTRASKANIEAFAERIAKNISFGPEKLIEMAVARFGGGISYEQPNGEKREETIRVEPDGKFKIFLPLLTSPARDRFTIAHELGHFFLHFPLVKAKHVGKGMRATRWPGNDPESQRCEWEANWFAAAFLMPKDLFKDAFDRNNDIYQLAAMFKVSDVAAKVRAKRLNLIPE